MTINDANVCDSCIPLESFWYITNQSNANRQGNIGLQHISFKLILKIEWEREMALDHIRIILEWSEYIRAQKQARKKVMGKQRMEWNERKWDYTAYANKVAWCWKHCCATCKHKYEQMKFESNYYPFFVFHILFLRCYVMRWRTQIYVRIYVNLKPTKYIFHVLKRLSQQISKRQLFSTRYEHRINCLACKEWRSETGTERERVSARDRDEEGDQVS